VRVGWDPRGRLDGAQVCVRGEWDRAVRIEPGGSPAEAALQALAADPSVAVELLFSGHAFLGVRLSWLPEEARFEALAALAIVVSESRWRTLRDALEGLGALLGLEAPLFRGRPGRVEIGRMNDWLRTGTLVPESAIGNPSRLADSLRDLQARVGTESLAVELAYAEPVEHWFGVLVGFADPKRARDRCAQIIRSWISPTPRADDPPG